MPTPDPRKSGPKLPSIGEYGGMGAEFGLGIVGLVLIGVWIDHYRGGGQWATIICAVLGIVGGGYNFIRKAISLSQRVEREQHDREPEPGRQPDDDGPPHG